MAATIQTGIKRSLKNYSNFCYWLNGIDVTDQNLDNFTPYIQGVSRIFVYKLPPFMVEQYPTESTNFRTLIETGVTRVDGIQDTNVEFVEFEGGFGGQKFRNVSLASNDTDTLTLTVYEQSGSPIREYVDSWVTGTRDLRSNVAHYHGMVDAELTNGRVNPYSEKNHTGEFIYTDMDSTGREIEYAALFAHAFPTKVPMAHLNYESRNREKAQLDLEFAVQLYQSPAINAVAAYCIQNSEVDYNYLDFTPNITATNLDLVLTKKYGSGNTTTDYSVK